MSIRTYTQKVNYLKGIKCSACGEGIYPPQETHCEHLLFIYSIPPATAEQFAHKSAEFEKIYSDTELHLATLSDIYPERDVEVMIYQEGKGYKMGQLIIGIDHGQVKRI